ncbi:GtrA family protein [Nonomuraea sp. NPDC055795]
MPVDWVDDPDSRVDVVRTALDDLRGMARLARAHALRAPIPSREVPRGLARQLPRFAIVGVVSTLAYLGLYTLLRGALAPMPANAIALLVTAVANTAANRRFTFGISGPAGVVRHQFEGLIAFLVGLALTTGGLALLPAGVSHGVELAAVVLANALATLVRFLLLRVWVFNPRRVSR